LLLVTILEANPIPLLLLKRGKEREKDGRTERKREHHPAPAEGFRRFHISAFFSFTMHFPLYPIIGSICILCYLNVREKID